MQHKSKSGVTSITAYDHQYQQREIYVPNTKVGLVIGKGGSHVVYFQHQSGAAIHIARESDEIPGGGQGARYIHTRQKLKPHPHLNSSSRALSFTAQTQNHIDVFPSRSIFYV